MYLNPGVVLCIIQQTRRAELMALGSFTFIVQFISDVYTF